MDNLTKSVVIPGAIIIFAGLELGLWADGWRKGYKEADERYEPNQVFVHDFDGDGVDDILVVSKRDKYLFIAGADKSYGSVGNFVPFDSVVKSKNADEERVAREYFSGIEKSIDDFLKSKEAGK